MLLRDTISLFTSYLANRVQKLKLKMFCQVLSLFLLVPLLFCPGTSVFYFTNDIFQLYSLYAEVCLYTDEPTIVVKIGCIYMVQVLTLFLNITVTGVKIKMCNC